MESSLIEKVQYELILYFESMSELSRAKDIVTQVTITRDFAENIINLAQLGAEK